MRHRLSTSLSAALLASSPLVLAFASSAQPISRYEGRAGTREHAPEPEREKVGETLIERTALREEALATLLELAMDEAAIVRANAIEALQVAPSRAERALPTALRDTNLGVRYAAAMVVGDERLRSMAPMVEPLLDDPSRAVRAAAIYALRRCGRDVDPSLLATMLFSRDLRERAHAMVVLGKLGDKSAAPMIRQAAMRAPDTGLPIEQQLLRLQAAEALYRLGDEQAAEPLRAALYPASLDSVEAAVLAAQILGEVQDRAAARQLVTRVEDRVGRDNQYLMPPELRMAAAMSLAKMGYRDGQYVAEAYLSDPEPGRRAQAALLLGETAGTDMLSTLRDMLTNDASPVVRVAAGRAIVRLIGRIDASQR